MDAAARTITIRRKTASGEKTRSFTIDATAQILLGGAPSNLGSFRPGQKVEITDDTTAKQVTKLDAQPLEPVADNLPPQGFVALFNGKDLSGWRGVLRPPFDSPAKRAGAPRAQLAAARKNADDEMRRHWRVQNGELIFDGQGLSLATAKDDGDFELWADWKIESGGDSGIYLRGMPQVQIWDHASDVAKGVGSGGLYNNKSHASQPLAVADMAVGKWNTFNITMIGDRVTIKLNDVVVAADVVLENYWEPNKPAYATGPIELQKHGSRVC